MIRLDDLRSKGNELRREAPGPVGAVAGTDATTLGTGAEVEDALVVELNGALRAGTVDLTLKIGRIVIERLYRGDLARWRAHGTSEHSFRKLAARAHRDLAISASSLYRAVALCELTDRLGVAAWKHLGVSHLRAVLGLADQDQRQLIAVADREHWTVERLATQATHLRAGSKGRAGRRPLLAFVKTINRLAKAVGHPGTTLAGLDQIDRLREDEVARLSHAVRDVRQQLELVEAYLVDCSRRRDRPRR